MARPRFLTTLAIIAGLTSPSPLFAQSILYVDDSATGANDGSNWCDAYMYLQDALTAARASGGVVTGIRVAQGRYKPDQGVDQTPGDRTATFELVNGVTISGGYGGCGAPDPDRRDFLAYESILSGDLIGDDALSKDAIGSNCCAEHSPPGCEDPACAQTVCEVYATCCTTEWSEFCADAAFYLCCDLCSDTNNCDNSYHVATSTTTDATAILDGFTITRGHANVLGTGDDDSGAGLISRGGSPTLRNCVFRENVSRVGFFYSGGGGGVSSRLPGRPTFMNCAFRGNVTDQSGGGAVGTGTFVDCLFVGNRAGSGGGGMSGGFSFTNCKFLGNSADRGGGFFSDESAEQLSNCILWGNSDSSGMGEGAQFRRGVNSRPTINYSSVQGWTDALGGVGNIGAAPEFINAIGEDGVIGTEDDNVRLTMTSPCNDAGDNSAVPADELDLDGDGDNIELIPLDLDEKPRFKDVWILPDTGVGSPPIVDMGAYESPDDCATVLSPPADAGGLSMCRALSFVPGNGGRAIGLRLGLVSLHHVMPPYTGGPSIPFTSFEGQIRWVGPPSPYVESTANPTQFFASLLQCEPYYRDWSDIDVLYVYGSEVVPSSFYDVQAVSSECSPFNEENYTGSLRVQTTRWGDIDVPFNPPSPTTQPDLADVAALVSKFRSAPGAPIKSRAVLAGSVPDFGPDIGFDHISACVDAFKGRAYPYTIASCP